MADENKGLNPKLHALLSSTAHEEGGWGETVKTEEGGQAPEFKKLLALKPDAAAGYITADEIQETTGKTAEELGLVLDDDNETSIAGVKKKYDNDTKRTSRFQDFMENEATDQDYIDIASGKYAELEDWTYGYGFHLLDTLKDSKFNSPSNNSKVFDELHASDDEDVDSYRESFASHMNLGWDTSEKVLANDDIWSDSAISSLVDNDSFTDSHVYKMVERFPEHAGTYLMKDKLDGRARELWLDKDDNWDLLGDSDFSQLIRKQVRSQSIDGSLFDDERDKLSPKFANQVINNKPGFLRHKNLDLVLGSLDESTRNNWIDETLGITGGEHQHTLPDESEDFNADNWDNWTEGSSASMDMGLRKAIAGSAHLTDDQSEHIKRHGSFDDKYELYHNKDIDTKHGVEMFNKWKDNHDEH